jgi:ribosomal protein L11 methyltransferase
VNTAHNQPTFVARLSASEADVKRVANLVAESLDPAAAVSAALELPDRSWLAELHFRDPAFETHIRDLVEIAAGKEAAQRLSVETLASRDWVKQSLEGLPPVHAGRFVVHGAHDRAKVPKSRIGVEIEAAVAFGTGHHGTTRGCLIALDGLMRRHRPHHILDLGTGSGVLAIAAAKALRVPVLATDIDPQAVRIARDNARLNRVGPLIEAVQARGLDAPQIAARAPFDLVMANILLSPLQRLAAPLARALVPDARVVLSGLLLAHENSALAAYRSQGLTLERRIALGEWVTLVMVAKARH